MPFSPEHNLNHDFRKTPRPESEKKNLVSVVKNGSVTNSSKTWTRVALTVADIDVCLQKTVEHLL